MEGVNLGLLGDVHGDWPWLRDTLRRFGELRVHEVHQLGDLGIGFPDSSGRRFDNRLAAVVEELGLLLVVTAGNHDGYKRIGSLPFEDRGFGLGPASWLGERIAVLPRGARFERAGWTLCSLGGAPSLDRGGRKPGWEWWPDEAITDDEVAAVVAGGPVDVLLTHDAPGEPYCAPAVAEIIRDNPLGWPTSALAYAAEGRARMTEAFIAVRPRLHLHGHFHVYDEAYVQVEGAGYVTRTVSVAMNGVDRSVGLLHLPLRAGASAPSLEWLASDGRARPR